MGSCAPQTATENALMTCLLQSNVFSKIVKAGNQGSSMTRYEHENRNIAVETADRDEAQDMRYSPWACEHCLSMCLRGFDTLLQRM